MECSKDRKPHISLPLSHCNCTGTHSFGKYICAEAEWARPIWGGTGTMSVCACVCVSPLCLWVFSLYSAYSILPHPGVLCFGWWSRYFNPTWLLTWSQLVHTRRRRVRFQAEVSKTLLDTLSKGNVYENKLDGPRRMDKERRGNRT